MDDISFFSAFLKMKILPNIRKSLQKFSSEWCFCIGAVIGSLCPVFAPVGFFLLNSGRNFCFLAGVLGALLSVWIGNVSDGTDIAEKLDGRSAGVEYLVELTDHRITAVEGLEQKNGITARVHKLRFEGEKEFHECSKEVIFYSKLPVPPVYGQMLSGRGIILPPLPGGWYDSWTLHTDLWQAAGVERSWRHYIFKVRDILMARVCSGIIDDDNRNLAAAFFFGSTGGMSRERRSGFAAAGTVHLFAVSGLHVGMFSVLLLLFLRFLPFRSRYFITAILTWGYVLLTGAAVSAVRAGIMITLFIIARGMLYKVSAWRILGLAAGCIIIMDPESLNSMGFQYSFLITAALLLFSGDLKKIYDLEKRRFCIMPFSLEQNRQRRIFNCMFTLFSAVLSGIIAVAAGSIVSIYNSVGVTPGAVAANWFTMPVLGMLFALLPLKLLASFSGAWCNSVVAGVISCFFDYLRAVAETASSIAAPFYSAAPGIWFTLLLIGLLLGALAAEKIKYKMICILLFTVLFAFISLMSQRNISKVAVISSDHGKSASAAVIFKLPGEAVVINPVYEHVDEIAELLKANGIFRISAVRFSEPSVKNISGLRRLASMFKVDKVVMPPAKRGDWRFRDWITETPAGYYYVQEGQLKEKLKILREKNKFTIEYPESGVMLNWCLEICYSDSGRKVVFRQGKEKILSGLLPWSSKSGVVQYEL